MPITNIKFRKNSIYYYKQYDITFNDITTDCIVVRIDINKIHVLTDITNKSKEEIKYMYNHLKSMKLKQRIKYVDGLMSTISNINRFNL